MYKVFEIDYHGRAWQIATTETEKQARAAERKALMKSGGEFPTFSTDGNKTVSNNGKKV